MTVLLLLLSFAYAQDTAPTVLSSGEATLLLTNLATLVAAAAGWVRSQKVLKEAQAQTAPTTPSALTEALEKVTALTKERDAALDQAHAYEEREKKRESDLRIGKKALADMEARMTAALKVSASAADADKIASAIDRLIEGRPARKGVS